jgi:hypothetical protein
MRTYASQPERLSGGKTFLTELLLESFYINSLISTMAFEMRKCSSFPGLRTNINFTNWHGKTSKGVKGQTQTFEFQKCGTPNSNPYDFGVLFANPKEDTKNCMFDNPDAWNKALFEKVSNGSKPFINLEYLKELYAILVVPMTKGLQPEREKTQKNLSYLQDTLLGKVVHAKDELEVPKSCRSQPAFARAEAQLKALMSFK